jgi:hypothetical protein
MFPIDKELKPKMFTPNKSSDFVRRTLTVAIALTAMYSAGTLQAQTSVAASAVDFKTYTAPSFAMVADDQSSASSSSSSSSNEQATVTSVDPLHLNAMQYERRRYGRPRYRGGNTNPDGSNKWMGYGGVGFAQPIGNTWHYDTPSWAFHVGFGRQFSYKFAVPVEFSYDNFGLTGQTINNQFTLYNNQINFICSQPANASNCATNGVTPFTSLDGNAHVWSFSLEPTYTFLNPSGEGFGSYVLAGAGYYHKVTNFTTPTVEEECYYFCEEYEANAVVDHYTSNAPGFNAGIGFTYKMSHFSNLRLYAEARYTIILNSQRTGVNVFSPVNNTTVAVANDYAPNSNRTTYIPIKFGVRF